MIKINEPTNLILNMKKFIIGDWGFLIFLMVKFGNRSNFDLCKPPYHRAVSHHDRCNSQMVIVMEWEIKRVHICFSDEKLNVNIWTSRLRYSHLTGKQNLFLLFNMYDNSNTFSFISTFKFQFLIMCVVYLASLSFDCDHSN